VLQESLLFPYTAGLAFEQHILIKKGVDRAFAGVSRRTAQHDLPILNPDAYLRNQPVPCSSCRISILC